MIRFSILLALIEVVASKQWLDAYRCLARQHRSHLAPSRETASQTYRRTMSRVQRRCVVEQLWCKVGQTSMYPWLPEHFALLMVKLKTLPRCMHLTVTA